MGLFESVGLKVALAESLFHKNVMTTCADGTAAAACPATLDLSGLSPRLSAPEALTTLVTAFRENAAILEGGLDDGQTQELGFDTALAIPPVSQARLVAEAAYVAVQGTQLGNSPGLDIFRVSATGPVSQDRDGVSQGIATQTKDPGAKPFPVTVKWGLLDDDDTRTNLKKVTSALANDEEVLVQGRIDEKGKILPHEAWVLASDAQLATLPVVPHLRALAGRVQKVTGQATDVSGNVVTFTLTAEPVTTPTTTLQLEASNSAGQTPIALHLEFMSDQRSSVAPSTEAHFVSDDAATRVDLVFRKNAQDGDVRFVRVQTIRGQKFGDFFSEPSPADKATDVFTFASPVPPRFLWGG
jgi:hypothetical protein